MENVQHTPTPWEHLPDEEGSPIVGAGQRICDMDCRSFSDDESFESQTAQMEADAAFIVRACNAHDELVAALKHAEKMLERHGEASTMIGEALAKAGEAA